jgi:hypothetical protein
MTQIRMDKFTFFTKSIRAEQKYVKKIIVFLPPYFQVQLWFNISVFQEKRALLSINCG